MLFSFGEKTAVSKPGSIDIERHYRASKKSETALLFSNVMCLKYFQCFFGCGH
jgi:hypothetical protein